MLAMLEGMVARAGSMPLLLRIQTKDWATGKGLQNIRVWNPARQENLESEATENAKNVSWGAKFGG